MTSTVCNPLVSDPANFVASTTNRTVGTVARLGCIGFGRQIKGPNVFTCTGTGVWEPTPVYECYVHLDESERLELGIGLLCAGLVILVIVCLVCHFCWCRKYLRREKYFFDRYDKEPPLRESRRSYLRESRRSRRFSDGDRLSLRRSRRYSPEREYVTEIRRTRRYSEPSIRYEPEVFQVEREVVPVVTRSYVQRPRDIVYTIKPEPEIILKREPSYKVIRIPNEEPYPLGTRYLRQTNGYKRSSNYILRDQPLTGSTYTKFSRMSSKGVDNFGYQSKLPARLMPTVLDRNTIYVRYDTEGGTSLGQTLPRARITELNNDYKDNSSVVKYAGSTVQPVANGGVDHSTNYFFGRQDFTLEKKPSRASQRDLSHVLYHGKGKMTEIYEEGTEDGKKSRLLNRDDYP